MEPTEASRIVAVTGRDFPPPVRDWQSSGAADVVVTLRPISLSSSQLSKHPD
jgi:hypothetical protein